MNHIFITMSIGSFVYVPLDQHSAGEPDIFNSSVVQGQRSSSITSIYMAHDCLHTDTQFAIVRENDHKIFPFLASLKKSFTPPNDRTICVFLQLQWVAVKSIVITSIEAQDGNVKSVSEMAISFLGKLYFITQHMLSPSLFSGTRDNGYCGEVRKRVVSDGYCTVAEYRHKEPCILCMHLLFLNLFFDSLIMANIMMET